MSFYDDYIIALFLKMWHGQILTNNIQRKYYKFLQISAYRRVGIYSLAFVNLPVPTEPLMMREAPREGSITHVLSSRAPGEGSIL